MKAKFIEPLFQPDEAFRLLVESVTDCAIFMLDPMGNILTWNQGAERLNGYSSEEAIGSNFSKFFPLEDIQRGHPKSELKQAARLGKYEEEGWRIRKDGSRLWASVTITPIRSPSHKLLGFAEVTRDLTERKNAEQRRLAEQRQTSILEQTNRMLDQIFNESPSFMTLTIGPDHVFERANQKYLEVLHLTASIMGKKVRDVFPEIESQGFIALLDQVYRTGIPYRASEAPLRLNSPDGKERLLYVDFVYQPVRNSEGEIYGLIHQGYEVTEMVLARKAIENERENYRNLFKQTPEMVCILKSPDHVFEFVNEAHIKALGFDATGMPVRLAQPESVEVHGILDEVYQKGKTAELHEIPVTVTDRLRYFNLTYAARRDQAGQINGVMILGVEVTDQVLSREALAKANAQLEALLEESRQNEEQLRTLANSIPQLAWMANPDGYIFWYNQRWYEYTGTTPEQMQGWGWQSVHDPKELPRVLEIWNTALKKGEAVSLEFPLRDSNGEFRWFLTKVTPVKSPAGKVIRWFGTNTDIHEQMQNREALAKAVKARDEFLSIASHELKTPLTSLKLQVQFRKRNLEKGDLSLLSVDKLKRLIEDDEKQINRLARLVDDMLDISRLHTGRLSLQPEEMELGAMVNEILERFSPQLQASGSSVSLEPSLPVRGYWDRHRIEQVFINLLTNSLKYGAERPIQISIQAQNDRAELRIKDHGIGIAKEDQERIFEPFERAISAHEVSGLGLGLHIAKQFIEAHRGRIRLESHLGHGSTFTIELPLKRLDRMENKK